METTLAVPTDDRRYPIEINHCRHLFRNDHVILRSGVSSEC
jgi:hypothetical protein